MASRTDSYYHNLFYGHFKDDINVWEYRMLSTLFIIPNIETGENTRQLISKAKISIKQVNNRTLKDLERNMTEILPYYSATLDIYDLLIQEQEANAYANESDRRTAVRELQIKSDAIALFEEKVHVFYPRCEAQAKEVISNLNLLMRLGKSFLAYQKEMGQNILKTRESIAKVTVTIKCVDAIWQKIMDLSLALMQGIKSNGESIVNVDVATRTPGYWKDGKPSLKVEGGDEKNDEN